jgi:hypothetical protein
MAKPQGRAGRGPQGAREVVISSPPATANAQDTAASAGAVAGTPATPPAAAAQPAKPAQPKQNGVTRPSSGTSTGRVWEIADTLSKDLGKPAPRADVMKAFEAEGGNQATGATQYGRWRKFHGLNSAERVASATPVVDAAVVEGSDELEIEEGDEEGDEEE